MSDFPITHEQLGQAFLKVQEAHLAAFEASEEAIIAKVLLKCVESSCILTGLEGEL